MASGRRRAPPGATSRRATARIDGRGAVAGAGRSRLSGPTGRRGRLADRARDAGLGLWGRAARFDARFETSTGFGRARHGESPPSDPTPPLHPQPRLQAPHSILTALPHGPLHCPHTRCTRCPPHTCPPSSHPPSSHCLPPPHARAPQLPLALSSPPSAHCLPQPCSPTRHFPRTRAPGAGGQSSRPYPTALSSARIHVAHGAPPHTCPPSSHCLPPPHARAPQVLADLHVGNIPVIEAWNKIDLCDDPAAVGVLVEKHREYTINP
jgi:hypothetical protein